MEQRVRQVSLINRVLPFINLHTWGTQKKTVVKNRENLKLAAQYNAATDAASTSYGSSEHQSTRRFRSICSEYDYVITK